MKLSLTPVVLGVAALGLLGYMATSAGMIFAPAGSEQTAGPVATIYKSPTCSCCGQYAAYLRQRSYDVNVQLEDDMAAVKEAHDIPYEVESCHTMEIGPYVIEGHVPEEAIQKLLIERPDIKGIGMAGMPSGSPGMSGPKNGDFIIYEITHDGTQGDVFMTI